MNKKNLNCWYAIRTFNCKEMEISKFLKKKKLLNFVPMTYGEKFEKNKEKPKRILVPVIHNYLFLQKTMSQKKISKILDECQIPLSVIKKEGTSDFYEISDKEMNEFRLLCDPQFDNSIFMERYEVDATPGKEVINIHGPFKGVKGKLHRKDNNFYFIKTLVGIGVMVRVSRWYCQVLEYSPQYQSI